MLTASLILAGFGLLAVHVLVVLVSPTRRCGRCHGKRVTESRWTGRIIRCPRCYGTGRQFRFGATIVHRYAWSARDGWRNRKED